MFNTIPTKKNPQAGMAGFIDAQMTDTLKSRQFKVPYVQRTKRELTPHTVKADVMGRKEKVSLFLCKNFLSASPAD